MMTFLALGCFAAAAVVALGVVLTGGIAIVAIEGEFVVRFLFSHRRIPVSEVTKVLATWSMNRTPVGRTTYQPPPIIVPQVTLWRRGQGELNVRTGLMKESAETIAARMTEILGS
ncbi:MAG TPA: hypothetical protein VN157_03355 [Caulobacter sp.]|nr:hypothetical protein [Caulobacter sp.]